MTVIGKTRPPGVTDWFPNKRAYMLSRGYLSHDLDAHGNHINRSALEWAKEYLPMPDPTDAPERNRYDEIRNLVKPLLYQEERDASPLFAAIDAAEAENAKAIKSAFRSGVHHGHTQAIEQVREHCNLYHGWAIHKKLELLLSDLRMRALSDDH